MNLEGIKQHLGNHGSRWLVAVILLPIVITSMLLENGALFFIVMLLAGGITWWEFSRSFFGADRTGLLSLGLVGWLAVAAGAFLYGPPGQSLGLVVALALGAAYCMWALERESGPVLLNLLGRFALGHLYLSFLMSFFMLLKKVDQGGLWLLYVLVATMAADTGAYYVGRKYQGPKLAPKISPNKTVSGLLGGAAAATLISAVFAVFLPGVGVMLLMGLGLVLGFWGAVGDLFESALKRALDIKDSSALLLGHGGFLDRLDSLLFNVVPVYILADHIANNNPKLADVIPQLAAFMP